MVASWFLPLLLMLLQPVPQIDRPVVDLSESIIASDEEEIAKKLVEHREKTGVQLAVLIVRTTGGDDIASYAQDVFDQWGGGSAERDDGALFILAIADRRSRLHLGYGLEPVISDATAKRMLDDLRPALKATMYGQATDQLVDDFIARTSHLSPGEPVRPAFGSQAWLWPLFGLFAVAVGAVLGSGLRRVWKAKKKKKARGPDGRWRKIKRPRLYAAVRDRPVQIVGAIVIASQLAMIPVLWHGDGYLLLYSFVLWLYLVLGLVSGATDRVFGVTFGVIAALVLLVITVVGIDATGPIEDASQAMYRAFSIAFAIGCGGSMVGMFFFTAVHSEGSGGSYSSSSYSSSSSSYSSSSYSSSYSSSSSSYSSSSYSGGGGSSGGGGASSSW